jgi:hypothetical protein
MVLRISEADLGCYRFFVAFLEEVFQSIIEGGAPKFYTLLGDGKELSLGKYFLFVAF